MTDKILYYFVRLILSEMFRFGWHQCTGTSRARVPYRRTGVKMYTMNHFGTNRRGFKGHRYIIRLHLGELYNFRSSSTYIVSNCDTH